MKFSFYLYCLILCYACGDNTSGQLDSDHVQLTSEEQSIVNAIDLESFAIGQGPLEITDSEFKAFELFGNATIVGLGEATHGTREFFQMKHRVFQYLVEVHDYNAFVFEMDLAEARIFDNWVRGKSNEDIEKLMSENMIFWTWRTKEVQALLEWMREYNGSKEEINQIGFYGVDTQFSNYDVDQIIEILNEIGIEEGDSVALKNVKYKNISRLYSNGYSESLRSEILEGIKYTREVIVDHQSAIASSLGAKEVLWAQQLVRHMEQVEQVNFEQTQSNRFDARDRFMADNTLFYLDLLGTDAKLALWAHNGHIANDKSYAGIFGGSQGSYLKNELGEKYQIVGFSFAKGSFTAVQQNGPLKKHTIASNPPQNSVNFLFQLAEHEQFIIPTKSGNNDLNRWFSQIKPFLSIGSVFNGNPSQYYVDKQLSSHYDFLIHFDETHNSIIIK